MTCHCNSRMPDRGVDVNAPLDKFIEACAAGTA
jgi:hypothetical protein